MSSSFAYEKLRQSILSLELAPGEALTERGLEAFLDTSRTTVRAALAKLENEGLVQRDGRGHIVAPIDFAEIAQALEFRALLEVGAARLSCERANIDQIKALKKNLEKPAKNLENFMKSATDFHLELARLSGNRFFVRSLDDVLTRLSRIRWFEAGAEGGRQKATTEHKAILEAIEAADGLLAEERIKKHLERSKERLLTTLFNTNGLQIRLKHRALR
ncbi:MAG: GntR family transcriptional regulator [Deinococcales bacterium]